MLSLNSSTHTALVHSVGLATMQVGTRGPKVISLQSIQETGSAFL